MCPSLPGWQCRVVVSSDRGFSRRYERLGIPAEPAALDTKTPSGFLFATLVSSQPPVTRFPASECGACFGLPDSPRLRPLAPPPPQGVATSCSQVSQLLWSHLTSSDRTSQFIDFSLTLRPRSTAGNLKTSQVPMKCFCTCHGSWTSGCLPSPHHNGLEVLPSIRTTISAHPKSEISWLNSPAHTCRCRRFT